MADLTPQTPPTTDEPKPLAAYQAERTARREGKEPDPVAAVETPDAIEAKTDPVVTPIEAPTHERFTDPDTNEVLDLRTRRGKRIHALVSERNTLRAQLAQSASRQPAVEAKTPPAAVAKETADAEPDPANYPNKEFDAGYLRDHAAFTAQKAVTHAIAEQQASARRAQAETEMGQTIKGYRERATAFAKTTPDFDAVITGTPGDLASPVMQHAIFASEQGPQIAYWLATHPTDAAQWFAETKDLTAASMPFVKRQLEALIVTPSVPAAPPQSRISNAPPPAPAVSGAQVPPVQAPGPTTSYRDYRPARDQRRRNAGLATV